MFYAESLSNYIKALKYSEIPDKVINKAKHCIIDSIACAIAGAHLKAGKILIKTICESNPNGESFIWGTNKKSPLLMSVFVNSALANVMDFDDSSFTEGPLTVIHPGCTIIPPAFSLGEYLQITGKDLLEAIVAGYEIQQRIGEALVPSDQQIKKVKGQGTFQTFGAMVVAAKLLKLSEEEMSNAFGIGGCNAPLPNIRKAYGNKEVGTTMVKCNYGMASFNGVLAALLAKNGFTGPANIFEDETGFWRMSGTNQFFPERLLKDLGEKYRIMEDAFKPSPCGRYFHSPIGAVLKTIKLHKINVEEIDSILVKANPYVVERYNRKYPKNYIEACFCIPFLISLEILKLPYGLEEHFRENIKNKDVLKYTEMVKVESLIEGRTKEKKDKGYFPAKAMIKVDGKTYSAEVDYPLGSPQNPMSTGQMKEKFFRLTEDRLGGEKSEKLFENLANIETIGNIKKEIIERVFR
jgi:2-methylcitrate dehydratase PrpD